MDPSRDELMELAQKVGSLRAALTRMRNELASVSAQEEALSAKLRALGLPDDLDDAKTTVDVLEVAGLHRPRKTPKSSDAPATPTTTLKAAAIGAGLMLGVAIVILLIINLVTTRRTEPVATLPPTTTATTLPTTPAPPPPPSATVAERDSIPPPPPPSDPSPTPSSAPSLASATVPRELAAPVVAPGSGTLTVICTPACNSVTDNGIPVSPTAMTNMTVPAGSHKLVLVSVSGVKRTIIANVTAGQSREVRAAMETMPDRGF